MRKESTKYIKSIFLAVLTTMLLVSCGGGGGGGGMVSFSNNSELHNGGDAGGWGGSGGGNNTSNSSVTGSLSSGAGTFTPPNDINWKRIDLTITVTSGGTTTTHTLANTETEAIAELLTSLKRGDVVEVTADITMVDDAPRTTSSGAVTIGVGDNHISIPTPYKFDCSMESCRNAYEDYGCIDYPSATLTSGEYSGFYTVNDAASKLPSADDIEAPGYKFDHWETIDGQPYTPGVSRGDVIIVPVMKPDYTCDYDDLPTDIVIASQQDFNDLISTHGNQDFSGKTITLFCNVSTSTGFTNTSPGFQGTFDGQKHTVALNVSAVSGGGNYYAGLFAMNASGGTIQSVKVTGSVTSSGDSAGYAGGIVADNNGIVKMCANSANVSGTARCTGGIAGVNNSGATISECYNVGTVRSDGTWQPMSGGITGWNYGAISDCYNTGTILGVSDCSKGGITGCYSAAGDAATVSNCYNTYNGSGDFGALCEWAASSFGVTNFYYDTWSNLAHFGSIDGTAYPLSSVGDLVTANPSIWQAGSPYPTLINAPY